MFQVEHVKSGNILTVYGTRFNEKNREIELLFNTHDKFNIWYWGNAEYYKPIYEVK